MPFCPKCQKRFRGSWPDHLSRSSNHHYCEDCDVEFSEWFKLKEHWVQSRNHHYCQYCDEHFSDADELEDHYDTSHYYCRRCRRVFKNEHGLKEHYRQSPVHENACVPCRRDFTSEHNLRQHLRSATHRSRDIECPVCDDCFVFESALVIHWEKGRCPSGANRKMVDKVVRECDPDHIITYFPSDDCWNGQAFECHLCDREFERLGALYQHLMSLKHEAKSYRCGGYSCGDLFSTLGGLMQHVESEKCDKWESTSVPDMIDSVFQELLDRVTQN